MSKQLDRPKSSLRKATRTVELRNRLRRASMVIENTENVPASRHNPSLWGTYKHYFCAVGGALIGAVSVLIGTALLEGSRTARPGEMAKMTNPMIRAVDRTLAQTDQLIKMLEAMVNQRRSKANFEEPGRKGEYTDCLENCAKSVRADDESDKWLLINCRNECISRYSEHVKEMRKLYTDSD